MVEPIEPFLLIRELKAEGCSILEAIKRVRAECGVSLGRAKGLVSEHECYKQIHEDHRELHEAAVETLAVSKKIWWVYIVRCMDGSLYTGISPDVEKRIATHNSGKGAKYTQKRLPVYLEAKREVGTKSQAMQLEYRVKHTPKHDKIPYLLSAPIPSNKTQAERKK